MSKPRLAIVGAGLSGSVLAAVLGDAFDVTVVEQSPRARPLYHDITCDAGGVTTTINRAAGLGGTTNYWHNALIELSGDELAANRRDPARFARWYDRAWSLFLTPPERDESRRIESENRDAARGAARLAHMVVPHRRVNAWEHCRQAYSPPPAGVVYGRAERFVDGTGGMRLAVKTARGMELIVADHFVAAAGGLSTPVLLASSFRAGDVLCSGYHDHPMAYVAKLRLRHDSWLKPVSCHDRPFASIRSGFTYRSGGLNATFYLRPALSLDLRSIRGEARYILSDLRNDPFSPRKILTLLTNIEALREAVLFKTHAGFRGDYYSVLMLGEQRSTGDRGLRVTPGSKPSLDWRVAADEHEAYLDCFQQFLADIAPETVDVNAIPGPEWEYRTAAHHSGTARDFLAAAAPDDLALFQVEGHPSISVCDASVLTCGGTANSGLTLVALAHQLADALRVRYL